ncbi:MAG: ATP-binding protein [Paludibacteraceae bacterium]|nr:ATP-binding protein [Paludibacteraceae bacterium]
MKYLERIGDELLKRKLRSSAAVLIEGPKWCGKTSMGAQLAKSIIYIQDPDKRAMYRKMADSQPSLLLEGETPHMLDEWQTIPVLWDAVRFAADQRQEMNQFILTGSATPLDEDENSEMEHTGTGRIARLRMRPMSLWESKESRGQVSLKALFDGTQEMGLFENPLTIKDLAYVMCRGGWPGALGLEKEDALEVAVNLVDELVNTDVNRVDKTEKNPDRVRAVLRSYARNISTMTAATTIMADVKANDISITDKTLTNYLTALRRLFIVEDAKAWQPSLRSKTGIRTSNKRHFVDTSIATAVLELNPTSILEDFNLFGFLFEDFCMRDVRVYTEPLRGTVYHYHDNSELESDLIIRLHDGRWAAVEVKTGSKEIEEAAENLIKLSKTVDTSTIGEPSFLMVLTAGQFAYRRADGVYIVPIGCLKD